MPKLTFGAYRDRNIEEVPDSYLQWGEMNFKGSSLAMVQDELKRRRNPEQGKTTKLSRAQFAEQLGMLFDKIPDGLNDQTVVYNGYEIRIKKNA